MKKINLTFKKICLYLVLMGFAGICYLGASNIYVELVSKDLTSSEVKEVPYHRVGIVLGTNPISRFTGRRNPFYDYRIEAATRLYKAGKIERILVSGDNGKKTYSEPDMMKEELVKAGIPEAHIYCDYAGFSTMDSMIRAKKVFGLSDFTVISQNFHNERAIAIAQWNDLDVYGYNAKDIKRGRGTKVQIREFFARGLMVVENIIGRQPRYLGDMIEIK